MWYIAENVIEGNVDVSDDNWNGGVQTKISFKKIKLENPWPSMPVHQQTAEDAYQLVLENAGAILPRRDAVDARILKEVRGGFATYEGMSYKKGHQVTDVDKVCGIIDTQNDVGGWPILKSIPAPIDMDHDGMPDDWEDKNRLNKENPEDRNNLDSNGYTMLEKYLNSLK
jgi:pectate lyase